LHNGENTAELERVVPRLANRWFVVRNAHVPDVGPLLLQPRYALSWLRGPMTRSELRLAREQRDRWQNPNNEPSSPDAPSAAAQSSAPESPPPPSDGDGNAEGTRDGNGNGNGNANGNGAGEASHAIPSDDVEPGKPVPVYS
jgi:hypothetical protein